MAIGLAAGIAGGAALSSMGKAIQALYGMGTAINDYLDNHILAMKQSENSTISQTGRVIESAKLGFGLGYLSSVVIIATGQILLGNTFSAVATVAAAATLTNPIAMTCAAVGAIYYGWNALSSKEQQEILEKLTQGLDLGAELIKSIIQFLITKVKDLLSSKSIAEFKDYIKEYASKFGRTLFDVTGKVTDFVKGAAGKAGEMTVKAGELTVNAMGNTTSAVKFAIAKTGETASSAADSTSNAFKMAFDKAGDAASIAADSTSNALRGAYEKSGAAASNLTSTTKRALGLEKDKDSCQGDSQGPT